MLKFTLKSLIFFFASNSLYALTLLHVGLSTDNAPGEMGEPGDLRHAINSMNQSLNTAPDDFEIIFDMPMTIQLNGILPIINNSSNPVNITIGNPGPIPTVTIDGNAGLFSGFFIPTGNVTIQNMIFQNLAAIGGNGGDGISGGGGGLGAGAAIYAPQNFLDGSNPAITLKNVLMNNNTAIGGNGGNYIGFSSTGNEGAGGGGGFSGNGGSIVTTGSTGGGGGGGFGGNGGNVTLAIDDPSGEGGGGGGGGGLGSRATIGLLENLGNGGVDTAAGEDGNGYGLTITAGSGGGGWSGGSRAGGGGGGGSLGGAFLPGGGGGGSRGFNGSQPQGNIPPRIAPEPSGGLGGDGAGGGGGSIVTIGITNEVDGQAGMGGYGGGGGGGAGIGASDVDYSVRGGAGGIGGGGGGGGVDQSGVTSAQGGDSSGGGGGGGGGPSNSGSPAAGGEDVQFLGGGRGGEGATVVGAGFGGGGGGGGSALGGAIFVDSNLNFTVEAFTGIPTVFNTSNNTVQAGMGGSAGSGGGTDGMPGTALGNSIFLRNGASLTFTAQATSDLLTLGDQVAFTDDTILGGGGSSVFVKGNGTIIYDGTTEYQGMVRVDNANFKVNGQIDAAPVFICRNSSFSSQRGTLSGTGTLTGDVFVNSGTLSPDPGETLTLGSLALNSANPGAGMLGSLVHIEINSGGSSLLAVTGAASLAGTLEITLDPSAQPGSYTLLTSSNITGTFDSITFTGATPLYSISYGTTFVQFDFLGYASAVAIPATVNGSSILNPAVVCCGRPVILGPLPVPGSAPTIYTITNQTGGVTCQIGQTASQTYLKMHGKNGSCTIVGNKGGVVSSPLTVIAP